MREGEAEGEAEGSISEIAWRVASLSSLTCFVVSWTGVFGFEFAEMDVTARRMPA